MTDEIRITVTHVVELAPDTKWALIEIADAVLKALNVQRPAPAPIAHVDVAPDLVAAPSDPVEIRQNPPPAPPAALAKLEELATSLRSPAQTKSDDGVLFGPSRNEIIRRDWAAGIHAEDIMRRCNELPGRRITNYARIGIQASALGVKRPPRFSMLTAIRVSPGDKPMAAPTPAAAATKPLIPFKRTAPIVSPLDPPAPIEPARPAVPAPAPVVQAAAPARAVPAPPLPLRTEERLARLRKRAEGIADYEVIAAALNCFPGGRLTAADVKAWMGELGLRAHPAPASGEPRSAARLNVLMAAFKGGDPVEQIAVKLNVLAGPRIDANEVRAWIASLGLKRVVEAPGGGVLTGLPKMDWNSALTWAIREGVKFPANASQAEVSRLINVAREEGGHRQWNIVEPRGRKMEIPHAAIVRAKSAAA